MTWSIRMRMWWMSMLLHFYDLEVSRGIWIWVGHMGIAFKRIPRFHTKLMIKIGASSGIRVSQFGPLVVTWSESR